MESGNIGPKKNDSDIYEKTVAIQLEKIIPSVLVRIKNHGHIISYTGIKKTTKQQDTCSVWHPSNNLWGAYEHNVPNNTVSKTNLDLKNRNFTATPFIVYKKDNDILSVQYSKSHYKNTGDLSLYDTFNQTNKNLKSIIFCWGPIYIRPGYEQIWYKCNDTSSETVTHPNQLQFGKKMLFKYENEIRLGIPLCYYKNSVLQTNVETNSSFDYCVVLSPFLYPSKSFIYSIKSYNITPDQFISFDSEQLQNLKLVSPKKIYSLEKFLNKNLYSKNDEKIKIYLNTRFHVFTSYYPKFQFDYHNYDIKIFEIYKSILCFQFLRFVFNILESSKKHYSNQQQQQNNFSIDEDTIDVYDTVEIYESNNINLSNMYDGSYKVYLAILVQRDFEISI